MYDLPESTFFILSEVPIGGTLHNPSGDLISPVAGDQIPPNLFFKANSNGGGNPFTYFTFQMQTGSYIAPQNLTFTISIRCPPGNFLDQRDKLCVPCEPGTFNDFYSFNYSCSPCPTEFYHGEIGSQGSCLREFLILLFLL